MIGYILYRRNELGKSFFLLGSGSNGKSTFISILKKFIGKKNYSSLELNDLGRRFKTAELFLKLVNFGEDISNRNIDENSIYKKLVTGETINVEKKGKDPFEFEPYSKLIFSANELPKINDTSFGFMRRLIIIPFNAQFKETDIDYNPYIIDNLTSQEALKYLLKLSVDGIRRVLRNKKFTEVESVKNEIKEFEIINNPLLAFLDENKDNFINNTVEDGYLQYSTWCISNGYQQLTKNKFSRELKRYNISTSTTKIDKKTVRIYVNKK